MRKYVILAGACAIVAGIVILWNNHTKDDSIANGIHLGANAMRKNGDGKRDESIRDGEADYDRSARRQTRPLEESESAVIREVKALPNWKETEGYVTRHFTLRYAEYIRNLRLPEEVRERVYSMIIETYLPHTSAEERQMEVSLRNILGNENYAALVAYRQNLSQRSFDETIATQYALLRPDASRTEMEGVSQAISQIDISKGVLSLIAQGAPVTDAQINDLMSRYDSEFTSAAQGANLDPQALAALKAVYQKHMLDEVRKALEWRRDHQPGG